MLKVSSARNSVAAKCPDPNGPGHPIGLAHYAGRFGGATPKRSSRRPATFETKDESKFSADASINSRAYRYRT
jgi:hypothetical protein